MGMSDKTGQRGALNGNLPRTSGRRHHWWRWILASVVVLVVAGVFVSVQSLPGPATPSLTLSPSNATAEGAGGSSIDGTWNVGKGSLAGYRVPEQFLWQHDTLVGRTGMVTGKFVTAHAEVSSAAFRVDLSMAKANGKTPSGLAGILDTTSHRDATFALTTPIVFGSEPAINKTFTTSATGLLAIRGTTRSVTFAVTARYDGSQLEATGSIPITFSDWNIKAPFAVQQHGIAEFLLVMHQ